MHLLFRLAFDKPLKLEFVASGCYACISQELHLANSSSCAAPLELDHMQFTVRLGRGPVYAHYNKSVGKSPSM